MDVNHVGKRHSANESPDHDPARTDRAQKTGVYGVTSPGSRSGPAGALGVSGAVGGAARALGWAGSRSAARRSPGLNLILRMRFRSSSRSKARAQAERSAGPVFGFRASFMR